MGAGAQAGGLQILLVEDQEVDALAIRRQLSGYLVCWARTAAEGVAALRRARFDAVLVDLHLPDSSPTSVVRDMVTAASGSAPVLVLTGDEDESMARSCVRRGADDFIAKSELDGTRLERRVAMALERQRQRRAMVSSEERVADWARTGKLHWEWDLRTNRVRYDAAWKERFGADADAATPDVWFDRVHPDDQLRVCDAIVGIIDEGKPGGEVRHRMRVAPGHFRWYSARLAGCIGTGARPTRVLGSHTDVTGDCENACPRCGDDNPAVATTCQQCGAELDHSVASAETVAGDDARHAWSGRQIAERFVVGRNIGAGGAGSVYLAEDRASGDPVALKILHPWLMDSPEARQRFLFEGRMQRALAHPNLVRVIDVGEADGLCFIATELATDGSLLDLLRARKRLSERRALSLFLPLIRGVGHAHEAGVVHRDIKPANIMLSHRNGRLIAQLTDFGVAKLVPRLSDTLTGAVVGTLRYMAPEQYRDAKHVDGRADIYSLAATLQQALTGRVPRGFHGQGDAVPVTVAHPHDGLRAPIAEVLAGAMADDPAARPPTCDHLADALESAMQRSDA